MENEIQKGNQEIITRQPAEAGLAEIIKLADPLLKQWTEAESEKHRRELEYEGNRLQIMGRQNRLMIIGMFGVLGLVLLIAGGLFYLGRDVSAMDLIKLVVGLGGAAFGGYGWARGRRTEEDDK
jgi:hypothetical protein